jgi:hypothetical protein
VIVVSAILAITGDDMLGGVAWLMLGGLIFATPWTILRHIFSERAVTLRTIFAAVSVYILIGLAFTFLDLGIQGITGSFFGDPETAGSADFTYYSYIVMTTIGFGDLTPVGSLPRASAVLEGIIAQVFLVTTVARLVSLYGMGQHSRSAGAGTGHPASLSTEEGGDAL